VNHAKVFGCPFHCLDCRRLHLYRCLALRTARPSLFWISNISSSFPFF
jgi:hypothetical protein